MQNIFEHTFNRKTKMSKLFCKEDIIQLEIQIFHYYAYRSIYYDTIYVLNTLKFRTDHFLFMIHLPSNFGRN